MYEEERILVAKLARRDDRAWEDFCRQYSRPLLGAVRLRFGCSEDLAEEIVHLTFIRCVKSIQTFDPAKGRMFDWLKAIARNEACTLLRKMAPREQVELDPQDQQWLERVDEAELPDQRLCRAEVKSLILNAVMALTSRYRQALVMKYLEDRRVADMAVALGQSEKAVESLLTRSRQAFKEHLTRRFTEPSAKGGHWL
jgi:RNA polymerase sigma-70 factor (ECF subfamily)